MEDSDENILGLEPKNSSNGKLLLAEGTGGIRKARYQI